MPNFTKPKKRLYKKETIGLPGQDVLNEKENTWIDVFFLNHGIFYPLLCIKPKKDIFTKDKKTLKAIKMCNCSKFGSRPLYVPAENLYIIKIKL